MNHGLHDIGPRAGAALIERHLAVLKEPKGDRLKESYKEI